MMSPARVAPDEVLRRGRQAKVRQSVGELGGNDSTFHSALAHWCQA